MKTTPWTPPPAFSAPASPIEVKGLRLSDNLTLVGPDGRGTALPLQMALYAAIRLFKEKKDCSLVTEDGKVLFEFNGETGFVDEDLKAPLAVFEELLEQQFRVGYQAALDWVASRNQPPAVQQEETPAVPKPSPSPAQEPPGHPEGRRRRR